MPFHMWTPDIYEGAPTPISITLCPRAVSHLVEVAVRLAYPLGTRYPQDEGEKGNNMYARQRNGEI
jgi:NADH:ubiquinone oxidoreductase subunit 2 (subunit N)